MVTGKTRHDCNCVLAYHVGTYRACLVPVHTETSLNGLGSEALILNEYGVPSHIKKKRKKVAEINPRTALGQPITVC